MTFMTIPMFIPMSSRGGWDTICLFVFLGIPFLTLPALFGLLEAVSEYEYERRERKVRVGHLMFPTYFLGYWFGRLLRVKI